MIIKSYQIISNNDNSNSNSNNNNYYCYHYYHCYHGRDLSLGFSRQGPPASRLSKALESSPRPRKMPDPRVLASRKPRIEPPERTALILGNEKEGIYAELLPLLDACVEIPQSGRHARSPTLHPLRGKLRVSSSEGLEVFLQGAPSDLSPFCPSGMGLI